MKRRTYKSGKARLYAILLRSLLCLARASKTATTSKPTKASKTAKAPGRRQRCRIRRKRRLCRKCCPPRKRPSRGKILRVRKLPPPSPQLWRSTDNSTILWDPASPRPPVEKAAQLTEKECCGNFLVQENQTSPQQLWTMSPGIQAELTQVSIFNDASSSGSLEAIIVGDGPFVLRIDPGTTGTFTDRNVRSIHIAPKENKTGIIEGKYCVTAFFRLGEQKLGQRISDRDAELA